MFGYVTVNDKDLSAEANARFRALYCGVCRALRARGGVAGQITLSFDGTFLALLLTALYEPEETGGSARCIVHPMKKRAYAGSDIISYAADMNLLLAYYKCLDGWTDDKNPLDLIGMKGLARAFHDIEPRYPRQSAALRDNLSALARLEKANDESPDAPARCFGCLLGELFVWREDHWALGLRALGEALGRFIYLMDAYDDLLADIRKKRYNPLKALRGEAEFDRRMEEILTLQMAQCADAFERLPIVKDEEIIRNVLYSGVWMKYTAKKKAREKGKHGTGSV